MTSSESTSDAILRKVRALFAKAERTEFPQEAESLRDAALRLMAKHSIDEALVAATAATAAAPDDFYCNIYGSYLRDRASLLNHIASVFNCKVVMLPGESEEGALRCRVFGFQADLDIVWTLWESLLEQMDNALHSQYRSNRSFRASFIRYFTGTVHGRMSRLYAEAVTASGSGAELVLVSRAAAVEDAFNAAYPNIRARRRSTTLDIAGALAGQASGEQADIFLPGQRFDAGQPVGALA